MPYLAGVVPPIKAKKTNKTKQKPLVVVAVGVGVGWNGGGERCMSVALTMTGIGIMQVKNLLKSSRPDIISPISDSLRQRPYVIEGF